MAGGLAQEQVQVPVDHRGQGRAETPAASARATEGSDGMASTASEIWVRNAAASAARGPTDSIAAASRSRPRNAACTSSESLEPK